MRGKNYLFRSSYGGSGIACSKLVGFQMLVFRVLISWSNDSFRCATYSGSCQIELFFLFSPNPDQLYCSNDTYHLICIGKPRSSLLLAISTSRCPMLSRSKQNVCALQWRPARQHDRSDPPPRLHVPTRLRYRSSSLAIRMFAPG
jgi:hypothetical protein